MVEALRARWKGSGSIGVALRSCRLMPELAGQVPNLCPEADFTFRVLARGGPQQDGLLAFSFAACCGAEMRSLQTGLAIKQSLRSIRNYASLIPAPRLGGRWSEGLLVDPSATLLDGQACLS